MGQDTAQCNLHGRVACNSILASCDAHVVKATPSFNGGLVANWSVLLPDNIQSTGMQNARDRYTAHRCIQATSQCDSCQAQKELEEAHALPNKFLFMCCMASAISMLNPRRFRLNRSHRKLSRNQGSAHWLLFNDLSKRFLFQCEFKTILMF